MFVTCVMTLARVRLSPHCLRTCTSSEGGPIAVGRDAAVGVLGRSIFRHESLVTLHARIICPLRIERVLAVIDRNDALGVFEAGRNQRLADRSGVDIEDMDRLPVEFGGLLDGLRAEFRRRYIVEKFGTGSFQRHKYPEVDGRIGQLVGLFRRRSCSNLRTKPVLQPLDVIFSEVVVLIENARSSHSDSFQE